MTLSEAMRKRIKKLLRQNDMNIWALCNRTGILASTLSFFMSGKRELINLKTLLHVCEGFEMELKEFFDDPIFKDVEQD